MLLWCYHNDHLPTFHLRHLLDGAIFFQVISDPGQQLGAQFLVRHLPTPESQCDLGLVPVFEELHKLPQLDLVVTFVRSRPKLNLFYMNLFLFALGRLSLLVLLEEVFAEIHDPADRWLSIR